MSFHRDVFVKTSRYESHHPDVFCGLGLGGAAWVDEMLDSELPKGDRRDLFSSI